MAEEIKEQPGSDKLYYVYYDCPNCKRRIKQYFSRGEKAREVIMFDFYITCKHCGKEDLHGWHPVWDSKKPKGRQICVPCREKMYERHKVLMDKLLKNEKGERRRGCGEDD